MNVLLFCYKGNKQTVMKQLLVFLLCLMNKIFFSFQNADPKNRKKYFADRQTGSAFLNSEIFNQLLYGEFKRVLLCVTVSVFY